MMRHALFAALLAAAATPAFAGTPSHQFNVDGQTYTYTASRDASGVVHLSGHAGVDAFDLMVRGRRVNGSMGVSAVSFTVPAETIARLDAEVPAAGQQAAVAAPATLAAN